MTLPEVLAQVLFVLGAGFLIANMLKAREILRWWRRRKTALLVWPGRKPPYYGLMLGIGMMLGVLILVKAYFSCPKRRRSANGPTGSSAVPSASS